MVTVSSPSGSCHPFFPISMPVTVGHAQGTPTLNVHGNGSLELTSWGNGAAVAPQPLLARSDAEIIAPTWLWQKAVTLDQLDAVTTRTTLTHAICCLS